MTPPSGTLGAGFRSLAPIPSDAPTRSTLVAVPSGGVGLHRTLDEPFRRDPRASDAFGTEVAAARRIPSHPALVAILGTAEGSAPWLAREYGPDGSVADLLAEGYRPTAAELAGLVASALAGLEALHDAGLVHGDPGPGNVLVVPGGGVRLADPCSARLAFAQPPGKPTPDRKGDVARLLGWAGPLARTLPDAGSPLAAEVVKLLALAATDGGRRRLSALAATLPPLTFEGARAGQSVSPAPVPAVLRVARLEDPERAYRVARLLADGSGADLAALRRALVAGTAEVPASFPEPARALVAALHAQGVAAEIGLQARSPATAEPRPSRPPAWELLVPAVGLVASGRLLSGALLELFSEPPPAPPGRILAAVAASLAGVVAHLVLLQSAVPLLAGLAARALLLPH